MSPRVLTRLVVVLLLALIGVGTLTALGAYRMSFAAPPWWRTVDSTDVSTIALAESTEQAVSSTIHRGHPLGTPWTVAVSVPQANAWVNVMLPRWLANQEIQRPAWASQIQVHFTPDWIGVGVMVPDELGHDRYVTLRTRIVIDQAGAIWLQPVGATIGRVGMPLRWTFEELSRRVEQESDSAADVIRSLRGDLPVADAAEIELGDGRTVRVLGVTPGEGRLLVTCVTER